MATDRELGIIETKLENIEFLLTKQDGKLSELGKAFYEFRDNVRVTQVALRKDVDTNSKAIEEHGKKGRTLKNAVAIVGIISGLAVIVQAAILLWR